MLRDMRRAIAIAAALFLVVLWSASSGSTRIWHTPEEGQPETPSSVAGGSTPVNVPITFPPPKIPEQRQHDDTAWKIMQTVTLTVMLVMLICTAWILRGVIVRRWSGFDDDEEDPIVPLPDVVVAVTEDAQAQITALRTGSPRNAIVACWIRLEEAVASAGLQLKAADTPAELTARVLGTYSVARTAIDELAVLYREARFSAHELGEEQRERALDALVRLHADLGVRAGGAAVS